MKLYPYAAGRLSALEKHLISEAKLNQMAEAKTPDDAMKFLSDAGYGEASAHDYEAVLSKSLSETYKAVKELVPDESFINLFLYKNDYHNIKVMIKEIILEKDFSRLYIDEGTVPVSILKKFVLGTSSSGIDPIMAQAVKEALTTRDAREIDIILDKAVFSQMIELSKESKNSFIYELVKIMCDLANLKSLKRIKTMSLNEGLLNHVFIPGGTLPLMSLKEIFKDESNLNKTAYAKLLEGNSSLTQFERQADNYQLAYIKRAKYMSLTIEPIIAYIFAKENEIRAVRIIMVSKYGGIDSETIKERLRDVYV